MALSWLYFFTRLICLSVSRKLLCDNIVVCLPINSSTGRKTGFYELFMRNIQVMISYEDFTLSKRQIDYLKKRHQRKAISNYISIHGTQFGLRYFFN